VRLLRKPFPLPTLPEVVGQLLGITPE
jgi:hypothetical protein